MLKHETLARLGHDERSLVPIDETTSQGSMTSSLVEIKKPRAIEYLNKGR